MLGMPSNTRESLTQLGWLFLCPPPSRAKVPCRGLTSLGVVAQVGGTVVGS